MIVTAAIIPTEFSSLISSPRFRSPQAFPPGVEAGDGAPCVADAKWAGRTNYVAHIGGNIVGIVVGIAEIYEPHMRSRYNRTMNMESAEVFNSLEGHLKSTDEIDLVVLRGHLILEHCVNALLMRWIVPTRFAKLNLNFAKKLDLYEALQEPQGRHWAEEIAQLRELNRIRNKLAHQLPSTPGHHVDVRKWACSVVGYTPKTINRRGTYRRTVLKAFYLLTGYLAGNASLAATIKTRDKEGPSTSA